MSDIRPDQTIFGRVVGSGSGVIYVEDQTGTVHVLDRFAAIRRHPDGLTEFKFSQNTRTSTKRPLGAGLCETGLKNKKCSGPK